MTFNNNNPSKDELEVSIFGPGFGEAIAVHLGGGNWVLVDSCIQPDTDSPAHIRYLKRIGLDPSDCVKCVVITHWHDDHVQGISDTVDECVNAEVIISNALNNDDFAVLGELYSSRNILGGSGVDELTSVLEILHKRKRERVRFGAPKWACADKNIFNEMIDSNSGKVLAKIHTLSPSDTVMLQSVASFSQLIPRVEEREPPIKIAAPDENDGSVVLQIKVGDHSIILGADLEYKNDPSMGWTAIVEKSTVATDDAMVFKVPHHGAKSGHDERVWNEMLADQPYALITPFIWAGHTIPTKDDIERINRFTGLVYVTSKPSRKKWKDPDSTARKTIKEATTTAYEIHPGWGHIRIRNMINGNDFSWDVSLFGDARKAGTSIN